MRSLKLYPFRYEYRVSRLNADQLGAMNKLLDMITTTKNSSCSDSVHRGSSQDSAWGSTEQSTASDVGVSTLQSIFDMFGEGFDTESIMDRPGHHVTTTRTSSTQAVTPIKRTHSPCASTTTPVKPSPSPKHVSQIFADFLPTTPLGSGLKRAKDCSPPPAKRGGIKARCLGAAEAKSHSNGFRPFLERAKTGNIRSTLRVMCPSEATKKMWVEVTLKQSKNHYAIIQEISNRVVAGSITSKEQAIALKNELL